VELRVEVHLTQQVHAARLALEGDSERWCQSLRNAFACAGASTSSLGLSVHWAEAVEIIRTTTDLSIGANQYDMPRVPRWWRGPMIVIGDAAHAASPTSGQGASLAIEDAVTPVLRAVRDLVLPMILKRQGSADTQHWIFNHHSEWDARVRLARAA
jgi:2-polyprenyl-6-methoxyphenol hydroxylase-like FAD-dependent oxidoreductase